MILSLFGLPLSEKIGSVSIGQRDVDLSWLGTTSEAVAEYIFGIKDSLQFHGANLTPYAVLVIFLMIWLLIFVTFGDIIETFSTFNPTISWLIAFCLATIAGFSGIYEGPTSRAILWLANWGTWAVVIGIFVSFIVFLLVETGVAGLSRSIRVAIMNRKLTQEAMGVKGKLMRAGMGAEALAEFEKTLATNN